MDPLLLRVDQSDTLSFSINQFNYLHNFPGIWHYHPEYELTLILKGAGTRFVGDHIGRFQKGDLIFIGKNLAHTWKTDFSQAVEPKGPSEALVVHFKEDFLGESFFSIPEMILLRKLLADSKRGIKIEGNTKTLVTREMKELQELRGANKLLKLLSILILLAESQELSVLSSEDYSNYVNEMDCERLNKVHAYIMNNFQGSIKLTEVAEIASMSPTAFSRYFTQRMRRSFSQYIVEKKVGYACKLLMSTQLSILQVCFECGFQNVSNFNKQFKKLTGLTPKHYQLTYRPFARQSSHLDRVKDYATY